MLLAAGAPGRFVRHPLEALALGAIAATGAASLLTPWLSDRAVRSAEESLFADRPEEAADRAEAARALNPFSVEPLFVAAEAAHAQGDVREALRLYVRATQLQPRNWRTWYELGSFEAGIRSFGWAELHLARARELDPLGPADRELERLSEARRRS